MSMKAAFALFAKKTGCERRIPFEVSVDPFYGDENLAQITIGTRVSNCERVEEILECKLDERYAADGGKSVLRELKCSKGEAHPLARFIDGNVLRALEMPADAAREHARPDGHQNADLIVTTGDFPNDSRAWSLTASLNSLMAGRGERGISSPKRQRRGGNFAPLAVPPSAATHTAVIALRHRCLSLRFTPRRIAGSLPSTRRCQLPLTSLQSICSASIGIVPCNAFRPAQANESWH